MQLSHSNSSSWIRGILEGFQYSYLLDKVWWGPVWILVGYLQSWTVSWRLWWLESGKGMKMALLQQACFWVCLKIGGPKTALFRTCYNWWDFDKLSVPNLGRNPFYFGNKHNNPPTNMLFFSNREETAWSICSPAARWTNWSPASSSERDGSTAKPYIRPKHTKTAPRYWLLRFSFSWSW